MATVLLRPANKTDGNCDYCGPAQGFVTENGENVIVRDGYIALYEFNYGEPYVYLGRCFRCNHRDRG